MFLLLLLSLFKSLPHVRCCAVPASELKGQGALVHLEVQTYGYAHNVLGLHEQAGACSVFVWDLRWVPPTAVKVALSGH
jgi:hypothetical protein